MTEKYWSKKTPDGSWDYIIIGSGIGGMAAASLLAKFGKRVLILEKHYQPGGFTHTFSRKGYTWDVGVHTIGQVTTNHLEGRILKTLCGDSIEWKSMGDVCEIFVYPDRTIKIPKNRSAQIEMLANEFPQDAAGIKSYYSLVAKALKRLEFYYAARCFPYQLSFVDSLLGRNAWKWLGLTTKEVMSPLFCSENLFHILTARWVYYGAPPETSSFGIQAVVDRHFHEGGYYPVGGGEKLATAFLRKVYEKGGWTRIRAHVTKLHVAKERITAVELANGERLTAPRIIAAIPAKSLNKLLPTPWNNWNREIEDLPSTPAHLCLYLGFKGDIRAGGASAANTWIFSGYNSHLATWNPLQDDIPGVLYCSFPSLKDIQKGHEKHTAEIITFTPWEIFQEWQNTSWKKRGEDYENFKNQLKQKIQNRFLQIFPQLAPMIEYAELSTPLSTNHFMGTTDGSIYGLAPTPARYHCRFTRPHTPIKGLYLGGSDMASPGIIGAMMGGVLSAVACCPISGGMFLLKHMLAKS